ncbi:MAG: hypothetical protein ACLGJA_13345 [Gammaproteobacteria bacterium]|jgi:hypothetical protein|uniref:hypothetical protein n=1 Tax=Pseudomonas urmiensis TaxID=2745493 RepID=UPI0039FA2CC6
MRPLLSLAARMSLCVALPAWAAFAAAESVTPWTQEPTAFLGIDLQGNFLEQIEECPSDSVRPTTLCRVASALPNQFEVRGLPYLPISPGYSLIASISDGKVNELVFSGNANSLYLVTEMLTDRFGEPGVQQSHWIKMSSGASYLSEVMSWKGENVAINFQRQESDLGRYAVTISPLSNAPAASTAEASTEVVEPQVSNL